MNMERGELAQPWPRPASLAAIGRRRTYIGPIEEAIQEQATASAHAILGLQIGTFALLVKHRWHEAGHMLRDAGHPCPSEATLYDGLRKAGMPEE